MDINISNLDFNSIKDIHLKKMIFIYKALENGWSVVKNENTYIFKKNHEGKKEIFLDDYLRRFMEENLDINSLLND
tara:strand:+ start:8210 stop:8437 length:228 start_codon:yes stop_codon:yes gene_type:complete